jgi:hypothetical protein
MRLEKWYFVAAPCLSMWASICDCFTISLAILVFSFPGMANSSELQRPHNLRAVVIAPDQKNVKIGNLPRPHTLRAVVKAPEKESGKLRPIPKPHTLRAVVEVPEKKSAEIRSIPSPHTLVATVNREEKKKANETKANLSGCWDDYTQHGSTETHEVVTVKQRGSSIQIDSKYQGRLDGASLHAEYQARNIEDMGQDWVDDNGKHKSASRELLSQAVKMLGHMPVYAYDLTVEDRNHMRGTYSDIHFHWVWEGEKKKKKVTSARYIHFLERMVRKTGKIQSLRITEPNGKAISSVAPGEQIRIEAKIDSVCKVGLQSSMVHVYPGHEKDIGMDVTLIETAPGSGVLRSMPLTIHPEWSGDAIRAVGPGGLRGAKVDLSASNAAQAPAPKVQAQPAPGKKAKPAVKPTAAKPKQKPQKKKNPNQSKPVKWTVYKLVVQTHGSRLPTMDVLKLSFQKGAKRAAFRVMRYSVSLARNDQTGKIIWSINSVGDVDENQMVIQKDMIDSLEIMANDKKKGGVDKAALAGLIIRQLGPDAEQKNQPEGD